MIDELSKQWSDLKEKRANLVSKRDTIKGRLDAEKSQLKELVEKIKAKGYDPKKLGSILKEKEDQLKKDVDSFAIAMEKVEDSLNQFNDID